MNDDQDIRGTLHRLASGHPLDPIDSGRLLDRGRRGKRRRRWAATGGGTLAAVSVVALVATMAPRLDARTPEPPAGRTPAGEFVPLPGVPRGDGALGDLSEAETKRRCQLRGQPLWPDQPFRGSKGTGSSISVLKVGKGMRTCKIPGDSRPSDALVAAAAADPLPADDAGRLRNCGVKNWHDLTDWRVMAHDTQPGVGTNLVALSPSGKYTLMCTLTARGKWMFGMDSIRATTRFTGTRGMTQKPPHAGHQTCDRPGACIGFLFSETGREAKEVARIRLTGSNGRTHDITVNDGWYALAWASGDRQIDPKLAVTLYDDAGKVIGSSR